MVVPHQNDLLTEKIIGFAIEVHRHLGPGLLESAYEECSCYELGQSGLTFRRQVPLPVVYKAIRLDCGYRMDVVVEERVILEIKSVERLMLIGAGRSFIAGADIRQFGRGPSTAPSGRRPYDVLDDSAKPVVAAIHGYALGGGLEIALACHYRVAVPSAKVGLPEVQIGILPGAGGTQRLPRLIGPKAALEMITSGRHVPAEEAHKLGIVDELAAEGELRQAAIAFARRVADRKPLPRIRDKSEELADGTPALFEATRKS